jgi:hypothetical protein
VSDIDADKILQSTGNYSIAGSRESGRTSLAHFLSVMCSEGACDRPRIPLVVEYSVTRLTLNGLRQTFHNYLGTERSSKVFDNRFKAGDLLVIVDNFLGLDIDKKADLKKLIAEYPGNRWILISEARTNGQDPKSATSDTFDGFQPVQIQNLKRKDVRALSSRWCAVHGKDENKTFEDVLAYIRHGNLPQTGYIVSLVLLAVHQERQMERVNEAVLLNNMINFLLGRSSIIKSSKQYFDPISKEITLQSLSVFMRDAGGEVAVNDLTRIMQRFDGYGALGAALV